MRLAAVLLLGFGALLLFAALGGKQLDLSQGLSGLLGQAYQDLVDLFGHTHTVPPAHHTSTGGEHANGGGTDSPPPATAAGGGSGYFVE